MDRRSVPVPLEKHFNATGFVSGDRLTGSGFDGGGFAYPVEALPEAITEGTGSVTLAGIPFQFSTPDGRSADHLALEGQTIPVPHGRYAGLALLGAAAPEPLVTGLVWIFEDGSAAEVHFGLSDWCKSALFGEKAGLSLPFRWNIPAEAKDPVSCTIRVQVVPCPEKKPVTAIRFGEQPNMHVFAVTLLDSLPWAVTPLAESLDGPVACEPGETGSRERRSASKEQEAGGAPMVGYITHYPGIKVGMDELGETGVTGIVGYIGASNTPDRELAGLTYTEKKMVSEAVCFAATSGIPVTWIINCAPVHAPHWLRGMVREEGDGMRFAWGEGNPWGVWPSFFSPTYLDVTHRYLRAMSGYIRERDPGHSIHAYLAGAEWFYPGLADYSPRAADAFRDWVVERHGGLGGLNKAWDADYEAVEEIELPEAYIHFPDDREAAFSVDEDWCDGSWRVFPYLPVEPSTEYEFSADLATDGVGPQGAQLQLAWYEPDGKLLRCDSGAVVTGTKEWTRVEVSGSTPDGGATVSPHFKLFASGTARMDNPALRALPDTNNLLAPADPASEDRAFDAWDFVNYRSVKGDGNRSHDGGKNGGACLVLEGRTEVKDKGYENRSTANADFQIFHCETLAKRMEEFIRTIKDTDSSRPVGTYLAYAWAMGNMWGYNYNARAVLDIELTHARGADAIGMQLASSLGDTAFATFAIDMARKYGKPMWATDLQDFSLGVAAGPRVMNRLAQACIQHGLDEIYWYDWFGTEKFDFYPGTTGPGDPRGRGAIPMEALNDINSLAADSIRRTAGMTLRSPVALIAPMMPYHNGMPDARGNDPAECFGWYYLVQDTGTIPDVITLYEIEHGWGQKLGDYDVVIVPDAFFGSGKLIPFLRECADKVDLVLSGRTGPYRDARIPGVYFSDEFPGKELLGPQRRVPTASNTPAMLTPARVRWEKCFRDEGAVKRAVEGLRDLVSGVPKIESEGFVTLAVHKNPADESLLLFLVNHDETPAEDVRIELPPGSRGREFRAWCNGHEKAVRVESGKIAVPRFETACWIVVKRRPAAGG